MPTEHDATRDEAKVAPRKLGLVGVVMVCAAAFGPAWPLRISVFILGFFNGVYAVAAIGSMMALETIKLVAGAGEPLAGRLLIYDGLSGESRTVRIGADPECEVCGGR